MSRRDPGAAVGGQVEVAAPAKLTLSLAVTGVRPDGYHLLDAEMVSLDLADSLTLGPGDGLTVEDGTDSGVPDVPTGPDNLVVRALAAAGRRASVRLVKRIPAGAGLGGGSADAAAVLRWAGVTDLGLAAGLGADVPFCLVGGRARVTGIGDEIEPLDHQDRRFVLLLPPFGVETVAVYRAWDDLSERGLLADPDSTVNHLELAAKTVEPRLAHWMELLAEVTGVRPQLAGSGSTWFVEGTPETFGLSDRGFLTLGAEQARLVPVRTVPGASAG